MKIVTDASELVHGCAFVPTMGALHIGHQSLFKIAASQNKEVLASISDDKFKEWVKTNVVEQKQTKRSTSSFLCLWQSLPGP